MRKILVTGANGFLGYYLVQQLLETGCQVLGTGKGPCRLPFKAEAFSYAVLDFTQKEEVLKLFEAERPDVVFHCGAMSKPDDCELNRDAAFLVNVTGTANLLQASAASKSFFIHLSTDFVFSGSNGPYREEDIPAPVNYYGHTKQLAEEEVKQFGYDWAIIRTVLVYGKPHLNRQNLLTSTAEALRAGKPLRIFGDQRRTPTYVGDLARGLIAIMNKKATGIYHLSGRDIRTPYQMAAAVADHLGLEASLITEIKEGELVQPAKRPPDTVFDITKATRELGFEPVGFEEGLRKTFVV
ncbi:MAG TPA: SDR family oxidoreductase [Flavisolibacter sp.]|nr:SDR family oxidoreductase [Flavisolibacter sp.]